MLQSQSTNKTVLYCVCFQLYTNLPHEYVNCLEIDTASASVPASRSFKLASEVALMIVFLFQCYPRRLQEHAGSLLPLMVQVQWQLPLRSNASPELAE